VHARLALIGRGLLAEYAASLQASLVFACQQTWALDEQKPCGHCGTAPATFEEGTSAAAVPGDAVSSGAVQLASATAGTATCAAEITSVAPASRPAAILQRQC
jgi:hypothetical protein